MEPWAAMNPARRTAPQSLHLRPRMDGRPRRQRSLPHASDVPLAEVHLVHGDGGPCPSPTGGHRGGSRRAGWPAGLSVVLQPAQHAAPPSPSTDASPRTRKPATTTSLRASSGMRSEQIEKASVAPGVGAAICTGPLVGKGMGLLSVSRRQSVTPPCHPRPRKPATTMSLRASSGMTSKQIDKHEPMARAWMVSNWTTASPVLCDLRDPMARASLEMRHHGLGVR
ncbi:uncharacterized protein [Miscanthus floridulus]|uniref:uncharacterized protein n=1 Tax=Miscanthus floridulus TaxID=154761 RepID=UPI003458E900